MPEYCGNKLSLVVRSKKLSGIGPYILDCSTYGRLHRVGKAFSPSKVINSAHIKAKEAVKSRVTASLLSVKEEKEEEWVCAQPTCDRTAAKIDESTKSRSHKQSGVPNFRVD